MLPAKNAGRAPIFPEYGTYNAWLKVNIFRPSFSHLARMILMISPFAASGVLRHAKGNTFERIKECVEKYHGNKIFDDKQAEFLLGTLGSKYGKNLQKF